MSSFREITASCHCGAFNLSVKVDATSLPQEPGTYCHCTTCRRRTGQLANAPGFDLPETWEPTAEQLEALSKYTTHTGTLPVTSYFCTTCGAKVFINTTSWALSPGLINGNIDGLMQVKGHTFVSDTGDGGYADMMFPKDHPRYNGADEESGTFVPDEQRKDIVDEKYLPMHCNCGAFSVHISRPAPLLPLPKNCYWYRPPLAEGTGLPTRFMATFCGCTSCRTATGCSLPAHPWVQIPFVDIYVHDAETNGMKPFLATTGATEASQTLASGIALGASIPGLTMYRSSEANARYHCSSCGATVIYFDSSRPWLGTWAAALCDDPKGARAESWLSWWTGQEGHPVGAVHCYDEAHEHDPNGAENLKAGLEDWGKKIGQRK